MATAAYILGRNRYTRPQAVIWSENAGTLHTTGIYIPIGQEIGADASLATTAQPANQFLILMKITGQMVIGQFFIEMIQLFLCFFYSL